MSIIPDRMRDRVKAVIIVQTTPFNADGSLDLAGLRANTQFLIDKCKGRPVVLTPTGSTGDAYALSETERIKVIETVIDTVAGALPVCGRGFCPRDRAPV